MQLGRRLIPETCAVPSKSAATDVRRAYTVQFVTPLYGGGVEAGVVDGRVPIRPTSIRGHLRFWWRLLAQARFVDGNTGAVDWKRLRFRESEIWGSVDNPSPVVVRVNTKPLEAKHKRGGERYGFDQFSPESYALFSAIQNNSPELLKEGFEFEIELAWSTRERLQELRDRENESLLERDQPLLPDSIEDIGPDIEMALSAWIAYGGLGARSRRGAGALFLKKLSDSTPALPPPQLPPGARLFLYQPSAPRPATGKATKGSPKPAEDLAMARWHDAVDVYQRYRQSYRGKRHAKRLGNGKVIQVPGRTHWPEPDSIRAITQFSLKPPAQPLAPESSSDENPHDHSTPLVTQSVPHFPRAVLGLPIGFHFAIDGPGKDGAAHPDKDPAGVELIPAPKSGQRVDRMASPVITRPVWIDGSWHAGILILPHGHALDVDCVLTGKAALWNAKARRPEALEHGVPNSQIVGDQIATLYAGPGTNPLSGSRNAIEGLIRFLGEPQDGGAGPDRKAKPVFREWRPA